MNHETRHLEPEEFHLSEDQCTDLVLGLLSDAEIEAVLTHTRRCAACETLFRRRCGEYERVRSEAVPAAPPQGHESASFLRRWPSSLWPVAAIAAAAGILLFLWSPWRTPHQPELVYWIPADRQKVQLRSSDTHEEALAEGIEAYDQRDARRAVTLLQDIHDGGTPEGTLRNVYLASALTHVGKPAEALGVLRELDISRLPQPWQDEALWIRYIALTAMGQAKEAQHQLEVLAFRPGAIGDLARERQEARDSHK